MIIPKVDRAGWSEVLDKLPRSECPLMPTVVVSPHPDDETLAVGGLIYQLRSHALPVTVVAVTDGENAYEGVTSLGPIREREQELALAKLEVQPSQIIRLRLPDSGLNDYEETLIAMLNEIIGPENHVVAPWRNDFHPDHEVCGRAAETAARKQQAKLSSYFFWTWHRGTPQTIAGLDMYSLPLSEEAHAAKHQALKEHQSQLSFEGHSSILPQNLLWPMDLNYEVLLPS